MSLTNYVMLDGHVGDDPEVRFMPDGAKVASVSLATNERYKDRQTGEAKTRTDWHNLSVGGPSVEKFVEFVKKGTALKVSGQARTRVSEKDGKKTYFSFVRVNEWRLGPKKQTGANDDLGSGDAGGSSGNDDDIPM